MLPVVDLLSTPIIGKAVRYIYSMTIRISTPHRAPASTPPSSSIDPSDCIPVELRGAFLSLMGDRSCDDGVPRARNLGICHSAMTAKTTICLFVLGDIEAGSAVPGINKEAG